MSKVSHEISKEKAWQYYSLTHGCGMKPFCLMEKGNHVLLDINIISSMIHGKHPESTWLCEYTEKNHYVLTHEECKKCGKAICLQHKTENGYCLDCKV